MPDKFLIGSFPLLLWLITIATMDFRLKRVSNLICILGLSLIFLNHQEDFKLINRLFFSILIFSIFIIFYLKGLMGAGDVKFIFVLSFLTGFNKDFFAIFIISAVSSTIHGILLRKKNFANNSFIILNNFERNIPYAGHFAIATIGWMLIKNST